MKTTNPGTLQVRRFYDKEGRAYADMLYNFEKGAPEACELIDPIDPSKRISIKKGEKGRDLLIPIFLKGKKVYDSPKLTDIRLNTELELKTLCPSVRRFLHPHGYFMGLEKGVYDLKMELIDEINGKK